jgi:hypothetical protein
MGGSVPQQNALARGTILVSISWQRDSEQAFGFDDRVQLRDMSWLSTHVHRLGGVIGGVTCVMQH